jgi:ribose transport system substrate-binding protein
MLTFTAPTSTKSLTSRLAKAAVLLSSVLLFNAAHAEDKPRIGLVMKSLANEFFQTMEQGARAHQKKSGKYELIANGTKDEGDTSGQIKIVEQMIVTQVDAIVIAPSDSKALIPVIKRAIDAGIVVVNIDNKLDEAALKEKRMTVPFVGPSDRLGAEKVGTFIAQQLKAGDKVAIIEGLPTANNAKQRTAGHQAALTAAKMNIISIQSGEWEISKANKVASSLINEHTDLKAILCGNDSMAIGAVAAVKAAGKTGKILVGGFDISPPSGPCSKTVA